MTRSSESDSEHRVDEIRAFYDTVYYRDAQPPVVTTRHLRQLARRIGVKPGQQVLDVACGVGEWLLACQELGALPNGVDLSGNAIAACSAALKAGEFLVSPAETLAFASQRFDLVTCLGSLEHFVDPVAALREMVRVAKPDARFLILVPNAGFLTRRLGLFAGTWQTDAKEEVRSLAAWGALLAEAGLSVSERWPDLHVLSWSWISQGRWYAIPIRALQALALAVWPLDWQYQVYHFCKSQPIAA